MQKKNQLPILKDPPELLKNLLQNNDRINKHFRELIRGYSNMHAFTSLRGKIDININCHPGPYQFLSHGRNYHLIGSLLPIPGSTLKFAQPYIFNTKNEVSKRINAVRYGTIFFFYDFIIFSIL